VGHCIYWWCLAWSKRVYCAAVSTVYWILLLYCFTLPPPHWVVIAGKMLNTFGSPFMLPQALIKFCGFSSFQFYMSFKNRHFLLHSNLTVFNPLLLMLTLIKRNWAYIDRRSPQLQVCWSRGGTWRNWDSIISIETRLWAASLRNHSTLTGKEIFVFFHCVEPSYGAHQLRH